MPRKHKDIRSSLTAKGFEEDSSGHHIFFVYVDKEGKKTSIRTKMSHSKGGSDVSDPLLSVMARQVRISNTDFKNLVDCPLDRDQYDQKVIETET